MIFSCNVIVHVVLWVKSASYTAHAHREKLLDSTLKFEFEHLNHLHWIQNESSGIALRWPSVYLFGLFPDYLALRLFVFFSFVNEVKFSDPKQMQNQYERLSTIVREFVLLHFFISVDSSLIDSILRLEEQKEVDARWVFWQLKKVEFEQPWDWYSARLRDQLWSWFFWDETRNKNIKNEI